MYVFVRPELFPCKKTILFPFLEGQRINLVLSASKVVPGGDVGLEQGVALLAPVPRTTPLLQQGVLRQLLAGG